MIVELGPGFYFDSAVPVGAIHSRPKNHNKWDPGKLRDFSEAIAKGGFTSGVLLRELAPGVSWEIIDGEHRVEAARLAGQGTVYAFVYRCGVCDDELALSKHIGHNVLRGTIDLAVVAAQLADGALSPVAAGVSEAWVSSLLSAMAPLELNTDRLVDEALGTDALLERTPPSSAGKKRPELVLRLKFDTVEERDEVERMLAEHGDGDPAAGVLRVLNET